MKIDRMPKRFYIAELFHMGEDEGCEIPSLDSIHWIDIKERKPDDNGYFWVKTTQINNHLTKTITKAHYLPGNVGMFQCPSEWGHVDIGFIHISHWMPFSKTIPKENPE